MPVLPRWLWVPSLVQILVAGVLCFVPLFDLLGYEFSAATALVAAVSATFIGLGAGRDAASGPRALWRAGALALAHLRGPLLLISVNALRVRNCDIAEGLAFYVLLPAFGSLYAAAQGVLVARLLHTASRRLRAAAAVLACVAPLAWSLWHLYWEPPIFAYDHLWGHVAGSLYDEVIRIGTPLYAFRAGTALRIAGIAALLIAYERRVALGPLRLAAAGVAVVLISGAYEATAGPRFGFRVWRSDIEAELSVVEKRDGIVIHLPPGLDVETRDRLADEHAYRLAQLEEALDVDVARTIHSYVYRTPAQKARLMGGSATMIAKPWLGEVHVHGMQSPHLVLAHELVHVVAAEFGTRLLGVSAKWVFGVNLTLVEGLAEALSPERDEVDLDGWARAMRELGIAPDIRAMLSPAGFWQQAPRRAYTVAGSFVRYLLATYGAEPLERAYAGADFEGAYGKGLDELVSEWETRIDARPLSDAERRIAEERFRRRSIFARTCAHEVAQLRAEAARADPQAAVELYRQICRHVGDTPASRIDLALALRRAGDLDGFLARSAALLEDERLNAVQRSRLLELRADLFWERGELAAARDATRAVLAAHISRAADRLAWVKLWAMDLPADLQQPVRQFLAHEIDPLAAVLILSGARTERPADKTLPYLIAYQLMRVEAFEQALASLGDAAGHPFATIEAERERLVAVALWRLGRLEEAEAAFEAYAAAAPVSGEAARARDMIAWIRWRRARQAQRDQEDARRSDPRTPAAP
jgi:tetratricopeptide (TPR) repeat protein